MLLVICALILVSYLYLRHIFSYWERKQFPFIKPGLLVGNLGPLVLGKRSMGLQAFHLHQQSNKRVDGIYLFNRPALLVRDPEFVKNILISDFNSFHDRGVYCDEKNDPVGAHLFALPGPRWRTLRQKFTPIFSSSKLKLMFTQTRSKGMRLQEYVEKNLKFSNEVLLKEIITRYMVSVVGTIFYGLDVDCLNDADHKILEIGKKFFEVSLRTSVVNLGFMLYPSVMKKLKIHLMEAGVEKYMMQLLTSITEYREKHGSPQNDFIQSLMQLRRSDESLSVEICSAQLFVFYAAGSETSSSTISFCIFELAKNQKLMREVQNEVDQVLADNNGEFTFESIADMKLLDACINETLRKYPALPILNRECTADYQFPNSDYKIEKGTPIIISLLGMHMDPKNFPNPNEFDPSRFTGDNVNLNNYYPFGSGPRNCIASRLGKITAALSVAMLLAKFDFESTYEDIEFDIITIVLHDKKGIKLKVSQRKI